RGIYHREEARLLRQLFLADASQNPNDLQGIENASAPERVGMEDLVGKGANRAQRIEVARCRRQVLRLNRVATVQMDHIQGLHQANHVTVVFEVARTAASLQVTHVRCAADRTEGHETPPDFQVMRGIACMQTKARGRLGHQLLDECRIKANALASRLADGACLLEDVDGFRVKKIDADLGKDLQGGPVNGFERLIIDQFKRTQAHFKLPPGKLLDPS